MEGRGGEASDGGRRTEGLVAGRRTEGGGGAEGDALMSALSALRSGTGDDSTRSIGTSGLGATSLPRRRRHPHVQYNHRLSRQDGFFRTVESGFRSANVGAGGSGSTGSQGRLYAFWYF